MVWWSRHSIFIECDSGYFHSNVFNNVSVIDPLNLKMIQNGKEWTTELRVYNSFLISWT